MKEKETKEECESMVKNYIKSSLKTDNNEKDCNQIHRVCPNITNDNGTVFKQVIVNFKDFSSR